MVAKIEELETATVMDILMPDLVSETTTFWFVISNYTITILCFSFVVLKLESFLKIENLKKLKKENPIGIGVGERENGELR